MKVYLAVVSIVMVVLACSKPSIENKPHNVATIDSSDTHKE